MQFTLEAKIQINNKTIHSKLQKQLVWKIIML
jgi:hypothetical protein